MLNIGCHLTVSKGYEYMGEKILELGGNTFQFFFRNPRGGKAKALNMEDVAKLEAIMVENNFAPILAHAPYTLNMAGQKEDVYDFAKMAFREDLERLESLPCHLYNFHPGSHTGKGIEWGMERIIKGLEEVVFKECTTTILFEGMAGKGSEIGSTLEELAFLLKHVTYPEKFGVCLDTCHLWETGYDLVDDLDGVLEKADNLIGIDKVKAIHLNDSKNPLGAHKDRHERIGEGTLGIDTIYNIITHPFLKDKPFYLETPNEEVGYKSEISLLKELVAHGNNR
ncbi:endonuclease IV [endosymbiont 'TC1' of Trimyema compressum]|uniref:deoxyribonuclease IV n=1 Tax=endosymbiont 'TC1' of Trimyema compressum TaxID=243899 RepID=UPI0007F12658|nr:deoxyribonuclease IV [endosymbiont 'TC1' of Trimyema compressum]AMP21337.1 endonuclease IV [endosymbiont 'TC1' of Trimyema compressum]